MEKCDEDLSKLLTPTQVNDFDRSTVAVTVVKILAEQSAEASRKKLSISEYTLVRDFLVMQIALGNASRSGVLSLMSVDDIHNARKVEDKYVVSVKEHKTSHINGPAKVVLDERLFRWLTLYVDKIRPQFTNKLLENCKVFLSINGESLSSGQISSCLKSVWKKSNLGGGDQLNCTIIRKTAVSTIHQHHPEQRQNLADLMCHHPISFVSCFNSVTHQVS